MDNENYYSKLVDLVRERFSFDCSDYNEAYIKRRLNARILANNLPHDAFQIYYGFIEKNPGEIPKLYDALTIHVTQFFRDTKLWEALEKDVLPKAINDKKEKVGSKILTIWSCGCSSGEEPYSLAILLQELTANKGIGFRIIATDIDEGSLKKSREAVYAAAALKSTPRPYLLKYFHKIPDTNDKGAVKYALDESIKSQVKFCYHNSITQSPPGNNFDMIFCRNVIIYFTMETKNKLVDTFHGALTEHGWLIIGKSEVLFTARSQNKFYIYNTAESIYRKDRRIPQANSR
jgi:chemotaxis protein methyltransferase CheR